MSNILGLRHQKVSRVRKLLRRRDLRDLEGVFVAEGEKLLAEAMKNGAEVESVFVAASARSAIVDRAASAGIRIHRVDDAALDKIASTVTPQPVLAIVRQRRFDLAAFLQMRRILVLVDVRDPGNLGTILRTAEAAGFEGVMLVHECVDVYHSKVVRSAAGAVCVLPTLTMRDTSCLCAAETAVDTLLRAGFCVLATDMTGRPYDALSFDEPLAFVLGNEAHGLEPGLIDACTATVAIPHEGRAESLNVSMAAAVLCFEVARQGRARTVTASPEHYP